MISKIQYISQPDVKGSHLENIRKALDAGCNWVQLRVKNRSIDWVYREAENVKALCAAYGTTFIVNDFVQIAKDLEADGVHLGLQDGSIAVARIILGREKIIGGTANTFEDIVKRHSEGVDYIGLGPFAFTQTKEKLSPILGITGYERIIGQMKQEHIQIPVIAIGGIKAKDMTGLMDVGVYGFAISGLLNEHPNPHNIFKRLTTGNIGV